MAYRLIALDLDGTLLNSKKQITPRTREALAAARARGIVTVIATGRTPHSARYWSRQIGGGPAICCNGAGILDETGAMLMERGLPQALLTRLITLGRESKLLVECYTPDALVLDRPFQQAAAYWRWVRPYQGTTAALSSLLTVWLVNRIRPVRSLQRWAETPRHGTVLKLMVIGHNESLPGFAARIRAEMPGLAITSSGSDNLEVTAAGVDKGSALRQLAARLQIPRDQIIAMGDSHNDLEMLRYAGVGVAMGNAAGAVQAAADLTTGTADEEGVARTIEELCLS